MFKTENLNEVVSSVVQTNEADLMIGNMDCSLGGELDVTQDLTAKVAATAVMGQVIEKLMETEAVKELAAEIDSKQTSENTGAAEVVSEAGDAAAGIIGAADWTHEIRNDCSSCNLLSSHDWGCCDSNVTRGTKRD